VNGVRLFSHTDDHRSAFSTQATDKMYGRVIFELLKVCDCVRDQDDGYGEPLNYLAALLQISRLRLAVDRSR
jgi:hypothetical protein